MGCCSSDNACNTAGTTTQAAGNVFTVEGMTCGSCAARVTAAARAVPGVTDATVDLATATLTVAGTATQADITAAVAAAGYTAHP
ncbi:cation transporter [Catellatospora chokoriensis]|uniref:HMA domain-containing protein n=1 Tax=Catellatospora chokoriensis TaxID=310353 RepID=A0A8J3K508_9ACTN|nr:heavy-metal-associated domain-containing protein [Catellatospora chokoriensis]GIF93053.1 hypothetical protein Cch02nite_64970 [Catellatospora chokoriensis]